MPRVVLLLGAFLCLCRGVYVVVDNVMVRSEGVGNILGDPSIRRAVLAEFYRRDFFEFVRGAWPLVESVLFVGSTYMVVLCRHLEWVYKTGNNLVINLPPRHGKSLIVSVLFPAWVWACDPSRSFLYGSHSLDLSLRDAGRCRGLVGSDWFVGLFGDVGLLGDANRKGRFLNGFGGGRQAVSVASHVTGDGADFRVLDDPLDAGAAFNGGALDGVNGWFDSVFSTRFRVPDFAPVVVVMQRLAVGDLSGHLLERGYFHLCLPFEFDPVHPFLSNTPAVAWGEVWGGSGGEWRSVGGALLCPERFSKGAVRDLKLSLGASVSAQLQQAPKVLEGGIFSMDLFGEFSEEVLYGGAFEEVVVVVDSAVKTGSGHAFSVFGLFGRRSGDASLYVLDILRGRWEISELVSVAVGFYRKHYGGVCSFSRFLIEDRSSGSQLIQVLRSRGLMVEGISRSGGRSVGRKGGPGDGLKLPSSKWERALFAADHLRLHGGRVLLPSGSSGPSGVSDGAWVDDFRGELLAAMKFGEGVGFWDQVDVCSDAVVELLLEGGGARLRAFML